MQLVYSFNLSIHACLSLSLSSSNSDVLEKSQYLSAVFSCTAKRKKKKTSPESGVPQCGRDLHCSHLTGNIKMPLFLYKHIRSYSNLLDALKHRYSYTEPTLF